MEMSGSNKFAFSHLMPAAKVGFLLPVASPSNGYSELHRDSNARFVESSARGFSAADLRHSFVVKALEKRGMFTPRPYVYICLRCRYTFLVNERRGSIVALDRKAQPIAEPENSRRLATFAQGPCPAFKAATPRMRRETVELPKPRKPSSSAILALFARIGAKIRYPYSVELDIHPPVGILPQDMHF